MIMAIVIVVLIIIALVGFLLFFKSRNKQLKISLQTEKAAKKRAEKKSERITTLHNKQQEIKEDSINEKNELEECHDDDLADRANNLFP